MAKILIISPCHNEALYIEETLQSVTRQSLKPSKWIIVDDNSTDSSTRLIQKYVESVPWITLKQYPQNLPRVPGSKVVQIFNYGLSHVKIDNYDFIAKLDTDLRLDINYFDFIISEFEKDQKLGIASGICLEKRGNIFLEEKVAEHHAHGATKIYRTQCFKDIGGLQTILGWDGIDEYQAQYLGWNTSHFRGTSFYHFRPTGAEGGIINGKFRMGRSFWFIGYHPLFVIARCIVRIFQKPVIIGSFAIAAGYFSQILKKEKSTIHSDLKKFIWKKQLGRLVPFLK